MEHVDGLDLAGQDDAPALRRNPNPVSGHHVGTTKRLEDVGRQLVVGRTRGTPHLHPGGAFELTRIGRCRAGDIRPNGSIGLTDDPMVATEEGYRTRRRTTGCWRTVEASGVPVACVACR